MFNHNIGTIFGLGGLTRTNPSKLFNDKEKNNTGKVRAVLTVVSIVVNESAVTLIDELNTLAKLAADEFKGCKSFPVFLICDSNSEWKLSEIKSRLCSICLTGEYQIGIRMNERISTETACE